MFSPRRACSRLATLETLFTLGTPGGKTCPEAAPMAPLPKKEGAAQERPGGKKTNQQKQIAGENIRHWLVETGNAQVEWRVFLNPQPFHPRMPVCTGHAGTASAWRHTQGAIKANHFAI